MLTPSQIQEKEFKTGIGYDKKDVEQFLKDLSQDYNTLLEENENLKHRLKDATESLSYYKSIEKTLQKALILAEKTAQDTKATALREAEAIELEAKVKARLIMEDARKQVEFLEHKTLNLIQQYDLFKIQFENLLHSQFELLNSKSFSIDTEDFRYPASESANVHNEAAITAETEDTTAEEAVSKYLSHKYDEELEDIHQIKFDFLEDSQEKSYQTEDGFEFFTMKEDADR